MAWGKGGRQHQSGDGDGTDEAKPQRSGDGDSAKEARSPPTTPPWVASVATGGGGGGEAGGQRQWPEEIPRCAIDPAAMVEVGDRLGKEGNPETPGGGFESNRQGPDGLDQNGQAQARYSGSGSPKRKGISGW